MKLCPLCLRILQSAPGPIPICGECQAQVADLPIDQRMEICLRVVEVSQGSAINTKIKNSIDSAAGQTVHCH